MENNKDRFSDYVETFKTHIEESRSEFINAELESEKILQSKIAKNIDFREKIEERLTLRNEKHESVVLKSSEAFDVKLEKSIESHDTKTALIDTSKSKNLLSIESSLEKEKSSLEKTVSVLESNFSKDEKKSLKEIEKSAIKAEAYVVEALVKKTEKDSQQRIKNVNSKLNQSLHIDPYDNDQVKPIIGLLKKNHAALETLITEYESRVLKLEQRVQKEDLVHSSKLTDVRQYALISELKSKLDFDKRIANLEYNIVNEKLKTDERKTNLEHKMNIEKEELRFYEDIQSIKRDRLFQLEKERVTLETSIQKNRAENVKNNFALSNKEHKNLHIYEKALYSTVSAKENLNYKLSLEEIDNRSKQLIERIKLSINELKTSFEFISSKVSSNLKTELIMPTEQIKLIEAKYKTDSNELTKSYNSTIKGLNVKLVVLDPSFDNEKIKEIKLLIEDVDKRYETDTNDLKNDLDNILLAYNSKIDFANNRAEKIISEARILFDAQSELYNKEIEMIKTSADNEKKNAKTLLDSIQSINNTSLDFAKEINELATNQNDDSLKLLVDLSLSNTANANTQKERRDQRNLERFEIRVRAKSNWLKENEAVYNKDVQDLENKLDNYTKMINKKLESEKRDFEKLFKKINDQLNKDVNKIVKEHKKIKASYAKALKDAEHKFNGDIKVIQSEKTGMLNQLNEIAVEFSIEIHEDDYNIFIQKPKKKKIEVEVETIE